MVLSIRQITGAALLFAGGSYTATADSAFLTAFTACKKVEDSVERLACFDALEVKKQAASNTLNQDAREDDFGSEDIKERRELKEQQRAGSITVGLLEAGTSRTGKYFFVLSNGQVWRQLRADTSRFKVPKNLEGVEVSIERRSLGAHVLKIVGKSRSLKVQRIR